LRQAIFGAPSLPFSISIDLEFAGGQCARGRAGEASTSASRCAWAPLRHRARFFPGDRPLRLRDLYDREWGDPGDDVLKTFAGSLRAGTRRRWCGC
jgi:hypothetical protein